MTKVSVEMEFQLSFYIPFPLIFVHIPCDVVMIVGDVFKSPMAFRKVEIQRLSHLHFWCRKEDLEVAEPLGWAYVPWSKGKIYWDILGIECVYVQRYISPT